MKSSGAQAPSSSVPPIPGVSRVLMVQDELLVQLTWAQHTERKGRKRACPNPLRETFYKFHTKAPLISTCREGWKVITGQQGAQVKIKIALLKRKKNMNTE